jgi:hypothetical protein
MRDDISAKLTCLIEEALTALREQSGALCEDFVAFWKTGVDSVGHLNEADDVAGG